MTTSKIWVVIATGPSLTREDVEYVRGKCGAVAISNAYELAPWADVLVSHDRSWWAAHPNALQFAGDKICRFEQKHCHRYHPPGLPIGCNSGLMGMFLARDRGAEKIILLGFDMQGTHYFGKHGNGLKNTPEHRFKQHLNQFARFSGCEVVNCTSNSKLTRYPMAQLRDVL